ncbi:MAG: DeoR family transcriptional regulator [Sarcina sp.]
MLAIVRRETIIDIIKKEKKVIVQKLAEEFSVTEETIRRDLEKLEEQDILKRTYGGAVLNEGTNTDIPISIRESMHMEEKIKIANVVAKDINDGATN